MVSPLSVKELRVVKNKAREFIKDRQIEKALIIYARILKLFPDDLESLLMLGDACLVRRDRERALKFYARAYELASWRADIVRRLEIANEPIHELQNTDQEESLESTSDTNEEVVPSPVYDSWQSETQINDSDGNSPTLDIIIENEKQGTPETIIEDSTTETIVQIEGLPDESVLKADDIIDEGAIASEAESTPFVSNRNHRLNKSQIDDLVRNISNDMVIPHIGEPISKEEIWKKIPIEKLRQRISSEQVEDANLLMDQILQSKSPSSVVANHLEDIDQLLPALIELNIRQTRNQGRSDLAEALEDVLSDVLFNVEEFEEEEAKYITQPVNINLDTAPTIIIDGVNSKESPFRLSHIQSALQHAGFNIIGWNNQEEASKELHSADYVLLHNPHCQQKYVKMLAERAGINKPTIVDFDIDFRQIPLHHPDYLGMGMSSPDQYRAFTTVIQLADLITVASQSSQRKFLEEGHNAVYLPEMWNADNELWHKEGNIRDTLNIGVMAITGQLSDIAEVRRGIVRVIREFPQTRLIVTGDADAYRLFDNLPEGRRAFYPDVEPDDYPFMLAQMDIILSPYELNANNQHHSDRILMEAGIKRVPWLASPIQAYKKWSAGGMLAEGIEDWYFGLKKLVLDPDARKKLSEAGYAKSQEREVKRISSMWEQALVQLLEVV